jgi:myo-inositol 2-dehydrogenase/D-chiro-inositol 1-dehydrogenase/scyllo-inositol 2-dehydrogenase (NAD+)
MGPEVRICLVGAGRVANVHASTIVNDLSTARLVAIVDSDSRALGEAGSRYGVDSQFPSFEEALEKEDFSAAVITTPTFTHRALAVMAAVSGKHVFLEKPMALDLAECDEILKSAADSGIILQLGFMRRFDPEFEEAAGRISDGEIGQPMMIKSLTHGPGLPPSWARDLKTSNGLLAEVNSHDWDTIRWLMGSDPARVYVEVANLKGHRVGIETRDYYDNVLVLVRFENNGLGSISGVCPCGYGYDARVEVIGEKGILLVGDIRSSSIAIATDREVGMLTPVFRTWPQRFAQAYKSEMRHFVDSVRSGSPPRVGGVEGRWAVACVLAGTRSFLEGRPVSLPEILAGAQGE